jgi:hypothetical protein
MPFDATARWVALPFASEAQRPLSGRVSIVLSQPATPSVQAKWAGLFIDEWSEVIPSAVEQTGLALQYDDREPVAPRAILVAVPPDDRQLPGRNLTVWDTDTIIGIIHETLQLARVRAIDLESLGELGQVLPAISPAANAAGDAVAANLADALIAPMER